MDRLESCLSGSNLLFSAGVVALIISEAERKPEDPTSISASRERVRVTVSIGAAQGDVSADEPEEVLKDADRALYAAKRGGRNRVRVFD